MRFARSAGLALLSLVTAATAITPAAIGGDHQMLKRAEFGEIASVFTAMAVRSAEAASSAESVSGYDGYVKYPLVANAFRQAGSGAQRIDNRIRGTSFDEADSNTINVNINEFAKWNTKLTNIVMDKRDDPAMQAFIASFESAIKDERRRLERMTPNVVNALHSNSRGEAEATLNELLSLLSTAASRYTSLWRR